jgi:hypothetical protein
MGDTFRNHGESASDRCKFPDTERDDDGRILAGGCCRVGVAEVAAVAAAIAESLPQIEQEVIAGIRPMSEYSIRLAAAGYSDADVDRLTALVQLLRDRAAKQQPRQT